MKFRWIYIVFYFVLEVACTSLPKPNVLENTLRTVEKLRIGGMTREEVVKELGFAPVQITYNEGASESWMYFVEGTKQQTMELAFDVRTSLLIGVDWFVPLDRPGLTLEETLSLFPGNHFKKHEWSWGQADYITLNISYIDNQMGACFEVDYHRKDVDKISFLTPGTIKEHDGFIGYIGSPKAGTFHVTVDRINYFKQFDQQAQR